ncbi:Hypothetical predicted protein [Marmota monax]|uniref:Uncharacterized protein n=1 Tax=Marmota monax TaxID=9995 RepID=A0A5E4AWF0_MARMO|nr:Hypothetical predicted protein [Marmota monax]
MSTPVVLVPEHLDRPLKSILVVPRGNPPLIRPLRAEVATGAAAVSGTSSCCCTAFYLAGLPLVNFCETDLETASCKS